MSWVYPHPFPILFSWSTCPAFTPTSSCTLLQGVHVFLSKAILGNFYTFYLNHENEIFICYLTIWFVGWPLVFQIKEAYSHILFPFIIFEHWSFFSRKARKLWVKILNLQGCIKVLNPLVWAFFTKHIHGRWEGKGITFCSWVINENRDQEGEDSCIILMYVFS